MGVPSPTPLSSLLLLLLILGTRCYARQVHVPRGPLYRVAGTAVSISCNVSDYEGPAQQDFEWFMYRPEAPATSLGIVSTKDSQFSYAVFGPRVASGDLQVQRLKGDSVVLKIARLQAQDSGYEDRHIAMEKVASRTYRLRLEAARPADAGTYRCLAKAYVRGSGTRLREAASARSRPLPVHVREEGVVLEAVAWLAGGTVYRGETASLLCNISVRGGPPGLRLAASWWVERPEEGELSSGPAQLVGGVGQDGVAELGVRPGGGPVSVELVGPRSHRLRLHGLGPEDEGIYHCAPSAWVQHADYSWYQAGSARSGPVTVYPYTHAVDTLFVPLLVGTGVALVTGASVLATITCCFMKRMRKR